MEAQIPHFGSLGDNLSGVARRGDINPPDVRVIAAGVVTEVFNVTELQGRELLTLQLQNTGVNPLFYSIDQPAGAGVSAATYHGVLAGGNAAVDGLGSIMPLKLKPTSNVQVFSTGGTTLCIVKCFVR